MKLFRKKVAKISCKSAKGQLQFYKTASSFKRKSFLTMQGLNNIIKDREVVAKYPLLILVGEYDIELAKRIAKKWHDELKNSNFFEIKNAGHCANLDEPIEFNRIVKQFIERSE